MNRMVKHFCELTTGELLEILRLRVAVFVVEQGCAYQEIDDYDRDAYHVCFYDEAGIQAYLRVFVREAGSGEVYLGRVISRKRRCGLGTQILLQGIETAKEKFHPERIVVEAQTYAKGLYEKAGFRPVSDEFLEDGIPHVKMVLEL